MKSRVEKINGVIVTKTLLACFLLEFFLKLGAKRVHFVSSCLLRLDLNVVSWKALFNYSDFLLKEECHG